MRLRFAMMILSVFCTSLFCDQFLCQGCFWLDVLARFKESVNGRGYGQKRFYYVTALCI